MKKTKSKRPVKASRKTTSVAGGAKLKKPKWGSIKAVKLSSVDLIRVAGRGSIL